MRYKVAIPLAGLLAATTMHAVVLIDDFQDATGPIGTFGALLPPNDLPGVGVTAGIPGLNRTISLFNAVTPAVAGVNVLGGGRGFLDNLDNGTESLDVLYTPPNPLNFAGQTLSVDYWADGSALGVSTIGFLLWDGANVAASTPLALAASGTYSVAVTAANFVGNPNPMNFGNIVTFDIVVLGNVAGADVSLDNFSVPEPGTYAGMFALGLAGFAAFRRFRR